MPFRKKRFQIETHKNKTLISGNPNLLKLLFVRLITNYHYFNQRFQF